MNYWIVIDRKKYGPLTLEELRQLPVTADCYVWHRGLPGWVRAKEVPALADLIVSASAVSSLDEGAAAAEAVELETTTAENEEDEWPTITEASDDDESVAESAESEQAGDAVNSAPVALQPFPTPPPPYVGPAPSAPHETHDASRPECPPTYIGWSIAAIIFCCLIPAIVALIYAVKVNPLYMRGDYAGARKASERAELWLLVAITLGIISVPFQIVMMMSGGGM